MTHASGTKRKSHKKDNGLEPETGRHEHDAATPAYHHAKQHNFLTGEDVLQALEAEMESNDLWNPTPS